MVNVDVTKSKLWLTRIAKIRKNLYLHTATMERRFQRKLLKYLSTTGKKKKINDIIGNVI